MFFTLSLACREQAQRVEWLRGQGSNLNYSASKADVLPITPPRNTL